jgi:GH15 family glucan-1,4-alpha-glucosidase
MTGGYTEEACAWREWLVNAVAGTPSTLQIMYGLAGERRLTELELPWLPGYEGSSPVRIGNAAHRQHQLDVYGELMDALHLARRSGLPPSENAWRVQRALRISSRPTGRNRTKASGKSAVHDGSSLTRK